VRRVSLDSVRASRDEDERMVVMGDYVVVHWFCHHYRSCEGPGSARGGR
jgi:hypothetical protein